MFEDLDETLKNIIQDSFIIKACQSTNRLRPYHSEAALYKSKLQVLHVEVILKWSINAVGYYFFSHVPLKNRLLCPRWPADALHNHLSLSSYEPAHLAYQIPNHLALGWGRTDNTTETISEVVEKFWRLVRLDKEGEKIASRDSLGRKRWKK